MELQPLTNDQAYLKMSFLGFGGTGKTFSASCVAIGLHRKIKSKKPVGIFDTETGSSYIADNFETAKVPIVGVKRRSFVDLIAFTKAAEKQCDIVVIDSITHPYAELVKGYKLKLNRERLRVQDWAPIKEEWAQFTELYLNTKLHIILCGRAGWEYEFREDDDGVTEIQKTGTRMKTETDFGYEPSLAVEMERVHEKSGRIGQALFQRAWVIKDRFNVIQGNSYDFPTEKNLEKAIEKTFKCFIPHIDRLKLGAKFEGVNTDTKSQELFKSPESRTNMIKRREIALENLKIECDKRWSTRSDAGAKARIQALEKHLGTASATAIQDLPIEKIEQAVKAIKESEAPVNA